MRMVSILNTYIAGILLFGTHAILGLYVNSLEGGAICSGGLLDQRESTGLLMSSAVWIL
jgi:hypothetical protein